MARCGCSGTSCSCVVQGDGTISVTGSGSGASPYVISGGGELTIVDSATVDLTLTGSGSSGDPFVLQADATVEMEELTNFDPTGGAAGDVVAWDGTGYVLNPPSTATPGASVTDSTLDGDGSSGDPLRIAKQATGTYTPTWTAATTNPSIGSGSITGRYHVDPTGEWCDLSILITCASDTQKGSGVWSLTLPPGLDSFASRAQILGLLITYPDGNIRVGQALMNGGSSIARLYATDPTRSTGSLYVSGSFMATWPSGGRVVISGRYELEP